MRLNCYLSNAICNIPYNSFLQYSISKMLENENLLSYNDNIKTFCSLEDLRLFLFAN